MEKRWLKLAEAENIDFEADDYEMVVAMLMLRKAFISVGHFFTRHVESDVKFDFEASLSGVYDAFRFEKHAEEAKIAGEELFNFLLARGKGGYQYDHIRLIYVLDDAGKVNPDATLLIFNFIQEWFSEKVMKFAMDAWEYQKLDEFFLTPFWGRVIVRARLFVEKKDSCGKFSVFREGLIRFGFKVNGDTRRSNWVIGEKYNPMRVTYAFPGWINIEQKVIDKEAKIPLLFQFPKIFHPGQTGIETMVVGAINAKMKKAVPDWRARLRFGTAQGDLSLVPSLN